MTRLPQIDWYQVKLFVQHSTGFSMDALHVVLGVLVQLAAAMIFRTTLARPLPLLAVLLLELTNEANDLRLEKWPHPAMQYGEGAKDVIMTMLLPVLIFFLARHRPKLFR